MKKGGFGKNKPLLITIVALVVLAAMILASAGIVQFCECVWWF